MLVVERCCFGKVKQFCNKVHYLSKRKEDEENNAKKILLTSLPLCAYFVEKNEWRESERDKRR